MSSAAQARIPKLKACRLLLHPVAMSYGGVGSSRPEGAGPYYSSNAGVHRSSAASKMLNPQPPLAELSSLQWPKSAVVPKRFQTAMQRLAQNDGDPFLEVVEREGKDGHGRLTVERHVRCKLCNRFATDEHLCQPVHMEKQARFLTESRKMHARRTLALAFASDGPPGRLEDTRHVSGQEWPIIGLKQYMQRIANRRFARHKFSEL